MACCGHYCLSLINTILLILAFPFLLAGWIIRNLSGSPCNPIVYKPLLGVGVFLVVLALIGILGTCCRITCFLWIYLMMILALIIVLAFILIFGATNIKGGSETVAGESQDKLQGFSSWLRNKMIDDESWADVKTCMKDHHACDKIEAVRNLVDFMNLQRSKLSRIEIDCCKPPSDCGFTFITDDVWQVPPGGFNTSDQDCKLWSNEKATLCYNCNACKASYLAQFMQYWRKLTIVNIVLLSFLTIVFLIGCCALM